MTDIECISNFSFPQKSTQLVIRNGDLKHFVILTKKVKDTAILEIKYDIACNLYQRDSHRKLNLQREDSLKKLSGVFSSILMLLKSLVCKNPIHKDTFTGLNDIWPMWSISIIPHILTF